MQLPDKVQTAIHAMAQYDMPIATVAPFWYRQYLRFKPETPPPLWGASQGYWLFWALINAFFWGTIATVAISWKVWNDHQNGAGIQWNLWLLGQFAIWSAAGVLAWLTVAEKRATAAREKALLGLPGWALFTANWRPSLPTLQKRVPSSYYWLRTLWSSWITKQAALGGAASFALVAWVLPAEAGTVGQVFSTVYLIFCFIHLNPSRDVPDSTRTGLYWAEGLGMGYLLAAVCWEAGINQLAGQSPRNSGIFLFAAITLAVHLFEWFSYNRQKEMAQQVERAEQSRQLAEVRLQMLKNQIEPHFIFNTLAHLKALIQSDPVVAERMADELSDFLRASLQSLREDCMTVAQDFELVRAYLALASLRMGARLKVDLNLEPATAHLLVPPLMLQTLVENAIQHGIEPKEGPGCIRVSARLDSTGSAPQLVLEVADDGVGFGQANTGGSGLGLVNIRERLATAFGNNAALKLSANAPQGVIATLTLPVNPAL
jgi:hypothetical protein